MVTQDTLRQMLTDIAKIWEDAYNGIRDEDDETYDNRNESALEIKLENDMLDFYTVNDSKGRYIGAEVVVTIGGPRIWFDTRNRVLKGISNGEYAEVGISDGLSEALEFQIESIAPPCCRRGHDARANHFPKPFPKPLTRKRTIRCRGDTRTDGTRSEDTTSGSRMDT